MPRPTRALAALALAAARGNLAAAAAALGCTVDELRAVAGIADRRGRPAKPAITADEARAIVERADPAEVERTGVGALARALGMPLSTLRGRIAARVSDGSMRNRRAARK